MYALAKVLEALKLWYGIGWSLVCFYWCL